MNNIYYLFSVKDKYFTDLSLNLKQKKLCESFYGLAYAKNPLLKNNIYSNVSYISDFFKKIGNVDHHFLISIEKKYHVNIANMIHADRHLVRYPKAKRLFFAQELIKIFIKEIKDYEITIVFSEGVDDFISYFAALFCKQENIKFFYTSYAGFSDRAWFSNTIDCEPNHFPEKFTESLRLLQEGKLDITEVEAELNAYVNSKKRPPYFNFADQNYSAFHWRDVMTFIQCVRSYWHDKDGMHYEFSPAVIPFRRLLKIVRKYRYQKLLAKQGFPTDSLTETQYVVYPLHFEPEASTLIQGRWFNDQLKIIELVSKSLPVDTILLVKEHKPSLGRRPLKYYREIVRHHNVFLIDDRMDTYQLIENSKGVIVISSTMGIEALMLKKPVMSFGERSYNVSSNVYKVENYKNIREQIQCMLNHQYDWIDSLAYFYALFASTKLMGCLSHLEYKAIDIEILANEMAQIM